MYLFSGLLDAAYIAADACNFVRVVRVSYDLDIIC